MSKHMIGALDLGTAHTTALIAEIYEDHQAVITGMGMTKTQGVVRGAVNDLDLAAASVIAAVQEAERSSGSTFPAAFLNISGGHIRSEEGYASESISGDPPDIRPSDIDRLIQRMKEMPVAPEEDMVHLIPNEFALDGIGGVHHPVGMAARKVEVKACRILVQHAPLQNLLRSMDRAQVDVAGLMVHPVASAEAVLTDEEKQEGVLLLDFGEGTTDLAFYAHGSVQHVSVVPIGGFYFTRDIALGLQIGWDQAEELKKDNGTLLRSITETPPPIMIPVLGGKELRKVSAATVSDILEARMQELCSRIKRNLTHVDMIDLFPRGMVVSGGGASMKGLADYLSREFRLPVRHGLPLNPDNLPERLQKDAGAAAVGLIRFGARQPHSIEKDVAGSAGRAKNVNILSAIRRSLQDFFR